MTTRRERIIANAQRTKDERLPKTLSLKRTTIVALESMAKEGSTDISKIVDALVEDLDNEPA